MSHRSQAQDSFLNASKPNKNNWETFIKMAISLLFSFKGFLFLEKKTKKLFNLYLRVQTSAFL